MENHTSNRSSYREKEVEADPIVDYKSLILAQLEKLGSGGAYLWVTFILCLTPSILNGFHASSYVFLADLPVDFYCTTPSLMRNNFTKEQIRTITSLKEKPDDQCRINNWNYTSFEGKTFEEVLKIIESSNEPDYVDCKKSYDSYFVYDQTPGISIVPEWDLVCGRKLWRTNVQMSLAVGKFTGAFTIGIIADKFGRKTSVDLSIIIYMISGVLSVLTPSYWLFSWARFFLGVAGAGVYHSAYTLLTEIVSIKHRAWTSTVYSISYPLGSTFLAIIAYYIRDWRQLQMALCLPAFLLFLQMKFLHESPRWLISKNRLSEAYEIVFRTKKEISRHSSLCPQKSTGTDGGATKQKPKSLCEKIKGSMHELQALYGPAKVRNRLLICHFGWFVVSFAYYVIALNGGNISANNYFYILIMGIFEIPSCFITPVILKYFGRRSTNLMLLVLSCISLSVLLVIPDDQTMFIMIMALFGRLCIASSFIVVILHTAELFPTEIRSSAIGTSSMTAHIGSISAPYVVDVIGAFAWFIPTTICAILSLAAGFLTMFLPETKNQQLQDNIDEIMDDDKPLQKDKDTSRV